MDQRNNNSQINQIPSNYKPISAWGYVGWDLLFSIPIAGFIVLLVFALGGCQNINLRKYARSKFCAVLLALIIVGALVLTGIFNYSVFGGHIKINF